MNTKEGILEKRIGDFAQREFYTNKHFIEELVSAKEAFLSPKKKYKFRRPLSKSFKFAYQGLEFAFCTQPNLRIHILTGALVIVCGLIVRLSGFEMAILSLIITSVIVAELINTAVETSLDWINGNKYNP